MINDCIWEIEISHLKIQTSLSPATKIIGFVITTKPSFPSSLSLKLCILVGGICCSSALYFSSIYNHVEQTKS